MGALAMISVIITIYNLEECIEKCISSVLEQTYKDLEIILVDDGSQDKSLEVCQKYAFLDSRIKIVAQKNSGSLAARRAGMELARGEYVAFIDGDDWVEPQYIEEMYQATKNGAIDVVIMNAITVELGNEDIEKWQYIMPCGIYDQTGLKNEFYPKMLIRGVAPSLYSKLFRKEIAYPHVCIEGDIKCDTDIVCTYPILLDAQSIHVIEACSYHYVRRAVSLSTTEINVIEYWRSMKNAFLHLKNAFAKYDNYGELLLQLEREYASRICSRMAVYHKIGAYGYLFPYEEVDANCKIILYGAGSVGRSFYKQLRKNQYCKVAAWIDKNFEKIDVGYAEIEDPEEVLIKNNFDLVVVCVEKEEIANEIMEYLYQKGIEKSRIIWKSDYRFELEVDWE